MGKNFVDNKDVEVFGRAGEISEERRRNGYNDEQIPPMEQVPPTEQQFPGDEIVDDLRELSRQQGQREGNVYQINDEQQPNRSRDGDTISETDDKEFRKEEVESPSDWQNERNYQNSEHDGNRS
ncbi:hypothetical protein V7114_17240 [Neobacillus niacini]|uniref:hypothetical protein n=1 Tax=Neobacillus niacini TaxID=86668 RepID=UPI002FFE8724